MKRQYNHFGKQFGYAFRNGLITNFARVVALCALLGGSGSVIGIAISERIPFAELMSFKTVKSDTVVHKVDVVFSLDLSAEMTEELKGLSAGIEDFLTELKRQNCQPRLGIVTFERGKTKAAPKVADFKGQPFTSDVLEFRAELQKRRCGEAGIDDARKAVDSLIIAANAPWEEGSSRVLVLISDASPSLTVDDGKSDQSNLAQMRNHQISQIQLVVPEPDAAPFSSLQLNYSTGSIKLPREASRRRHFSLALPQLATQIAQNFRHASRLPSGIVTLLPAAVATGLIAMGATIGVLAACLLLSMRIWPNLGRVCLIVILSFFAGIVASCLGMNVPSLRLIAIPANLDSQVATAFVLGILLTWNLSLMIPLPKWVAALFAGVSGVFGTFLGSHADNWFREVPHNFIQAEVFGSMFGIAIGAAHMLQGRSVRGEGDSSKTLSIRLSTNRVISLRLATSLTSKEIPGSVPSSNSGIVALVIRNPRAPDILGLQNQTTRPWTIINWQGQQKQVDPGRSVQLVAGTRINFGQVQAEIC